MKKLKLLKIMQPATTIAVILIAISSGTTAIGYVDAETGCDVVELDGSIIAEVHKEYLGAASPSINLSDSQTLEFNVIETEDDTYYVNSVLKIDIEVVGNVSRKYLLGRYITTRISIIRENKKILSLRGLLQRWFVGKPVTTIRINILSEGEKYIELPLQFETSTVSENASMYIFVRGTPHLLLARGSPVFAFERIHLEFVYLASDNNNDSTPPVTIRELEGEILRVDAT